MRIGLLLCAMVGYGTSAFAQPRINDRPKLPGAVSGVGYNYQVNGAGGTGPYSFTITGGALPGGLSLSPTGAISGSTNAVGTANFTVTITDSMSVTASKAF